MQHGVQGLLGYVGHNTALHWTNICNHVLPGLAMFANIVQYSAAGHTHSNACMTDTCAAGMHRNPDTFANPEKFDINHFLGSKACLANSPSFRPFGHGRKVRWPSSMHVAFAC